MPKIAISYRRADSSQIAGRIRERLAARYGQDSIFIDIHDIPIGSEFPEHIQKVWSQTDVLLVLIGPNWLRRGDKPWPTLAAWYVALPAALLLIAHYLIINSLDLHSNYLRLAAFVIPLPFGAAFSVDSQRKPLAPLLVGAALGFIATAAMTASASIRYQQPILPSSTFEWLESLEYVVSIALGFLLGNLLARMPKVSSWFRKKEDWVLVEVETALASSIPIIPVLLEGASMPGPAQLPKSIRDIGYRAATEVRSGLDFDSHMARLTAGIDKILDGRPSQR
jgi:hypothetical protein